MCWCFPRHLHKVSTLRWSLLHHFKLTPRDLLHIVQDQIHQLVIALERSDDCRTLSNTYSASGGRLTFSTAVELDGDLLVDVLGQVKDVLLLPLCTAGLLRSATTTSTAASTATATKIATLRHGMLCYRACICDFCFICLSYLKFHLQVCCGARVDRARV